MPSGRSSLCCCVNANASLLLPIDSALRPSCALPALSSLSAPQVLRCCKSLLALNLLDEHGGGSSAPHLRFCWRGNTSAGSFTRPASWRVCFAGVDVPRRLSRALATDRLDCLFNSPVGSLLCHVLYKLPPCRLCLSFFRSAAVCELRTLLWPPACSRRQGRIHGTPVICGEAAVADGNLLVHTVADGPSARSGPLPALRCLRGLRALRSDPPSV